ncbi:MAG: DNA oxidative demethylase AlkB [Myxococcales bacterium]|nr:DNA oxidative demethylase AlkB [Myxococcales bacterium]
MQLPLLADPRVPRALGEGAWLLPGLALDAAPQLLADVAVVAALSPWRHMHTPGGFRMSVAMTNCGAVGWVTDARGYRYTEVDPTTGRAWPAMPASLLDLAVRAAERAGFSGFAPDACLVNRYAVGARMTLHQDKNERDFAAPIVSVSLGLPATFLFGGETRAVRPARVPLVHGDVVVWGGPARLRFHGVLPVADGHHARVGAARINLTFRRGR